MRRGLSPMGRAKPGDLSPSGKVGGGKRMQEGTETHLKPMSLLSPGFLVFHAVLNSSSQTNFLKDLERVFRRRVGYKVDFLRDSGLQSQSYNGYSTRSHLSLINCCFCPLLIILRSLCWYTTVVCFCTHRFQNTFCLGGCTWY